MDCLILCLNETILLYHNIRAAPEIQNASAKIDRWSAKVPPGLAPTTGSRSVTSASLSFTGNAPPLSSVESDPSRKGRKRPATESGISGGEKASGGHGMFSDDEEVERQAALSSPVKGPGNRVTHNAIVKIVDVDLTPRPRKKRTTADMAVKVTEVQEPDGVNKRAPRYTKAIGDEDIDMNGISAEMVEDRANSSGPIDMNDEDVEMLQIAPQASKASRKPKTKVVVVKKEVLGDDDIIELDSDVKIAKPQPPPSSSAHYTNKDLPSEITLRLWSSTYIPSVLKVIGTLTNPFTPELVSDYLKIMQLALDATYGHIHVVNLDGPVRFITNQRISEWKNGFALTSMTVIDAFFRDQGISSLKKRAQWAEHLLFKKRFLFHYNEGEDRSEWRGLFRHPFIIRTLDHHLTHVNNALKTVRGLYKADDELYPAGAIAMAVVAVQRTLKLYAEHLIYINPDGKYAIDKQVNPATGTKSWKVTAFDNDKWGGKVEKYTAKILQLSEVARQQIVTEARETYNRLRGKTAINVDDDSDEDIDNLCEAESEEADE